LDIYAPDGVEPEGLAKMDQARPPTASNPQCRWTTRRSCPPARP